MKTLLMLTVTLCLVAGCTTHTASMKPETYAELAAQPTPPAWHTDSTWSFIELDTSGQIQQSMLFRVTDRPANACLSGDWKALEIIGSAEKAASRPAYSLNGRHLQILLSTELCDAYSEYVGTLSECGFSGKHQFSGMFGGKEYGKVYAVPVAE
jgi:hypothetical protein